MRTLLGGLVVGALLLSGCGAGTTDHAGSAPDRAQLAATPVTATVVAVGDIACPPGSRVTRKTCRQARTARAATALAPDNVIALGDEQYQKGSYRGFTHSYAQSWGKLLPITYPVVGNHEYYTSGARGYFRYFASRQPGSPGWYRRELNGWQLYFLNSNCGVVDCGAEKAWLVAEMAANPSTCSLVAMHHPRFSSGGEHGSSRRMKPFWDIAYAHGADIALAGHDHDQERFEPMTPAGALDPSHGIQQFVSGGGGRSLYAKGTPVAGSAYFRSGFGVLELTLGTRDYSWRFLSPGLRVRDSGSAACR
ncbi:acid phosphatase type 7 [Marmoricola sp. URHA0025 HA25]